MKEDIFTCDVCEKSTTSPMAQKIWTTIRLNIQSGVARIGRTIDLCPTCQEYTFLCLKDLNKGISERKSNL